MCELPGGRENQKYSQQASSVMRSVPVCNQIINDQLKNFAVTMCEFSVNRLNFSDECHRRVKQPQSITSDLSMDRTPGIKKILSKAVDFRDGFTFIS